MAILALNLPKSPEMTKKMSKIPGFNEKVPQNGTLLILFQKFKPLPYPSISELFKG